VRVNVQTWRDLGRGTGPFDTAWRAHGPWIVGSEESCVKEEVHREKGSVRDAFEASSWGLDRGVNAEGKQAECGVESEWDGLAYSWQLDKKREEERDQEMEWRAVWKYIERRASVEAGKMC
jgi:hypothetical protein